MIYFINVIRRDPQVQLKIKDIIEKYIKLSLNYQSKIGYDTLIQNIILKELINLMGVTIVYIDKEIKMKINRIKSLESKFL